MGKPRKGLASCNYEASATPTLSPIIRVRFEVRFSGPLRAGGAREPPRGIRDPNVHVNPRRNWRQRGKGLAEKVYQAIYYTESLHEKSITSVFKN